MRRRLRPERARSGARALLLPLLLGAACATAPVREAPAPGDSHAGRALYERSCQKCHALFMPSSYDAGEWKHYVRKYGARARLRAEEKELVYAYLAGAARR